MRNCRAGVPELLCLFRVIQKERLMSRFIDLEPETVLQQKQGEFLAVVCRIETELGERWSKAPDNLIAVFVQCEGGRVFKAFVHRSDGHIIPAFLIGDHDPEVCDISGETFTVYPCGCFY